MAQVWSASTGMDVDDVWDDSELIKMYDQSIQEVYSQSTTTGVTEKTFTGEDGKTYTWKVGGKCMAPFTEDGKTDYYAASIDSIGGDQNTEVAVTFLYYGNQAVVHVKDLWENEAAVTEAVEAEKKEKTSQKKKQAPPTNAPSIPLPSFAPPVPPNIVGMVPASEREALSSMLMSWYMSGYHTGYYQALADRRDK